MAKIISIIQNIISLPVAFYKTGNKSFYDLLKETGYIEKYNIIFEDNIANGLLENPELIGSWFEWSENKRTSNGWYLAKNENRKYEVGRIDQDGKKGQFLEFDDRRNACATFIKREIEEFREY